MTHRFYNFDITDTIHRSKRMIIDILSNKKYILIDEKYISELNNVEFRDYAENISMGIIIDENDNSVYDPRITVYRGEFQDYYKLGYYYDSKNRRVITNVTQFALLSVGNGIYYFQDYPLKLEMENI